MDKGLEKERQSLNAQMRKRQADVEDVIESLIARYGWVVRGGDATDDGVMPVYAYTVGLGRMGIPELMVVGLPHPMCGALLNELAGQHVQEAKAGHKTMPGPLVMDGVERRFYLLPIGHEETALYAPEVLEVGNVSQWPLLQLCWADRSGVFPWESGFAYGGIDQPVLGKTPGVAH